MDHLRLIFARLRAPARGRQAEVFLLAWLVPGWLVFEVSLAKLPHYTMPLLPPLALLVGRTVYAFAAQHRTADWKSLWWVLVGLLLPVGALVLAVIISGGDLRLMIAVVVVWAVATLVVMAYVVQALRSGVWVRAHGGAIVTGVIGLIFALMFFAPALVPGARTARLWREVERFGTTQRRLPIASVYHEDSVVFMSRGWVERIAPDQQSAWLASHPGGVLIGRPALAAEGRDAIEAERDRWWVYGPVGERARAEHVP